jgi:hypothetical protein
MPRHYNVKTMTKNVQKPIKSKPASKPATKKNYSNGKK